MKAVEVVLPQEVWSCWEEVRNLNGHLQQIWKPSLAQPEKCNKINGCLLWQPELGKEVPDHWKLREGVELHVIPCDEKSIHHDGYRVWEWGDECRELGSLVGGKKVHEGHAQVHHRA